MAAFLQRAQCRDRRPHGGDLIGFNLWKEAVSLEGSVDVRDVRRALGGLRLKAPSGFEVVMDLSNHHPHKSAVIGRITADARIVPIWNQPRPDRARALEPLARAL
ncbi:MAG TPA: hypothetical protein DIC31_02315 [Rhizobiales bacterium]|nr:hypothetical protein [Hyphomicrobiales bacterium]HCL61311.1 hypothetical protein [Hyphomicrobiales bacterium]